MTSLFDHYQRLDAALVECGFPATSPFWLDTLARMLGLNRRARRLVARVGRRGGKSSTLCRVAVVLALAGDWTIPPGDVGVVAFVSTNKTEASARIRTIAAILAALGVAYRTVDGGIDLLDSPIVFRVFACTVAAVSGFTSICVICDEVSKWKSADSNVNPAPEVLAAIRPSMATQPNALEFLISSPMSTLDAHAEAFDEGENEHQIIAHAASWIAHPALTESMCRALEPHPSTFLREYAAIPSASVSSAFDVEAVERAFKPRHVLEGGTPIVVIDASSLAHDAFTFGAFRRCAQAPEELYALGADGTALRYRDGTPILLSTRDRPRYETYFELYDVRAFEGGLWNVNAADVVAEIARFARHHGAVRIVGDQREEFALSALFRQTDITYVSIPWTGASKPIFVERVRRWLANGELQLPADDKLRRELHAFSEKFTASGAITYGARTGHDDRVALLLSAAAAEQEGLIPNSSRPESVLVNKPIGMAGGAGRLF